MAAAPPNTEDAAGVDLVPKEKTGPLVAIWLDDDVVASTLEPKENVVAALAVGLAAAVVVDATAGVVAAPKAKVALAAVDTEGAAAAPDAPNVNEDAVGAAAVAACAPAAEGTAAAELPKLKAGLGAASAGLEAAPLPNVNEGVAPVGVAEVTEDNDEVSVVATVAAAFTPKLKLGGGLAAAGAAALAGSDPKLKTGGAGCLASSPGFAGLLGLPRLKVAAGLFAGFSELDELIIK